MDGTKKKLPKKELLILVFLFFAVLSVIVGLGLTFQFFRLVKEYYEFKSIGLFSIPKEWQEVDFMTGIYAASWLIVGLFLLFIAQLLKIKQLKFQIESLNNNEKEMYIFEKFEIKFMNFAKQHDDLYKRLELEFRNENLNKKDYRTIFELLLDIFSLKNENKVQEEILNKAVFSQKEAESIINTLNKISTIDERKKAFSAIIFKKFHYYLHTYFESLKSILKLAYDYEKKEFGLDKILTPESKYIKQADYLKKQLSKTEIYLIRLFCSQDSELERLCRLYRILD
ncbi:MAG TPA: hypothetical protein DDX39_03415 [Bacteroidales bacterium]|nr:MAG: hypothetical protein A2W98_12905 [Bacteroidetes bacterium GWF2_33_38]OFY86075.1 MAG: hypothetical protein A2236_00530 [Bacteroidetes bacterium RIFOXYA2_FULL_33_7]HBF87668.1 hypothetical protein [Bacteroidales bacterium]